MFLKLRVKHLYWWRWLILVWQKGRSSPWNSPLIVCWRWQLSSYLCSRAWIQLEVGGAAAQMFFSACFGCLRCCSLQHPFHSSLISLLGLSSQMCPAIFSPVSEYLCYKIESYLESLRSSTVGFLMFHLLTHNFCARLSEQLVHL